MMPALALAGKIDLGSTLGVIFFGVAVSSMYVRSVPVVLAYFHPEALVHVGYMVSHVSKPSITTAHPGQKRTLPFYGVW